MPAKPTWKELLARGEPLILPCAHDALAARLIERAGFSAYSVGGYALVGARHALPDIGLVAFGEMSAGIRDIMAASSLPVLVDCDDGYGDAKNVARTIAGYEAMGVAAIFMEDQRAPKRCGHMAGKDVIDADAMAAKLRAAVSARRSADFFIIARTDARAVHGLDEARVSRRAADREHGGMRRAHAGAAAERALPPGLRHGGLSDLAHLPRRARDREHARRPQGRQARG